MRNYIYGFYNNPAKINIAECTVFLYLTACLSWIKEIYFLLFSFGRKQAFTEQQPGHSWTEQQSVT